MEAMAGLQRSAVSFRRQGSSGLVWDDRFISEELAKQEKENNNNSSSNQKDHEQGELISSQQQAAQEPQVLQSEGDHQKADIVKVDVNKPPARSINTMERSRSNGGGGGGGRGYRTGRVSPAIEPPSPRVSACGFCSAFRKPSKNQQTKRSGKRRSRQF